MKSLTTLLMNSFPDSSSSSFCTSVLETVFNGPTGGGCLTVASDGVETVSEPGFNGPTGDGWLPAASDGVKSVSEPVFNGPTGDGWLPAASDGVKSGLDDPPC